MNDDLDAIRRVLAADVESFRRLMERYQRPLLTLIRNLTPADTDHEEVAQEVFLDREKRDRSEWQARELFGQDGWDDPQADEYHALDPCK